MQKKTLTTTKRMFKANNLFQLVGGPTYRKGAIYNYLCNWGGAVLTLSTGGWNKVFIASYFGREGGRELKAPADFLKANCFAWTKIQFKNVCTKILKKCIDNYKNSKLFCSFAFNNQNIAHTKQGFPKK